MKKIIPAGVALGVALAWLGSSSFRLHWDQQSLFSSLEWWGALVLLVCILSLSWQLIGTKTGETITRKKNVLQSLGLGVATLSGALLVMGWNIQSIQYHSHAQTLTLKEDFVQKANMIEAITQSSCEVAKQFLLELPQNDTWQLSMFDKHWIKEQALQLHQQNCLSSQEVFDVVKHLRFRPTYITPPPSATYHYSFHKPSQEVIDLDLAIHVLDWCVTVEKDPSLCPSLPNDILLSPSDYKPSFQ